MDHLNVEIKARCDDPDFIRAILKERNAVFKGVDRQRDTYFNCPNGRLKLREGEIENCLIHYSREDQAGPKESLVTLYETEIGSSLKEALSKALGVLAVVEKRREIYFIGNIKFHIDVVDGLGSFVEIEAIDSAGEIGREKLQRQCEAYIERFKIDPDDLIDRSYSDMVLSFEQNEKEKT